MGNRQARYKLRKRQEDVDRALRALIDRAYHEVPHVHQRLGHAGLHPSQIAGVADLPRIPVIARRDLMSAGEEGFLRRSCERERLVVRHTTGTTGEPLAVYLSRTENLFRRLSLLDTFRRYTRLPVPLTLVDVGPESKDNATDPVHRIGPIQIVRLFRAMPLGAQIEQLRKHPPTILEGRPSTLWLLAKAYQEQGLTAPRPRHIFSYAEMLYPPVRTLLEETFGAPVADLYNSEEIGNIAWQCPKDPEIMHPNTSTCWLEAVNDDGKTVPEGTIGRLVVTNLYNHTMPFIRYEMGDRGALLPSETCACGFVGPRMRLTEGRDENFFVLPDGRRVTPRLAFDAVNAGFPHDDPSWSMIRAIRVFQIVQTQVDEIMVRVVPGPSYDEKIWALVHRRVQTLHPDLRLRVELVDDLTPPAGRKFQQVLGMLDTPWNRIRNAASTAAHE